jgi:2-oxoglutarate dehydrogenase E2 component (dihydrolipoamide succinyltransferase)
VTVELKVPTVGESITEVQIGEWLKSEGDYVSQDEAVVMIETDKVTVELPAPVAGVIQRILKRAGEAAAVGEVVGMMEAGGSPAPKSTPTPTTTGSAPAGSSTGSSEAPAAAPAAAPVPSPARVATAPIATSAPGGGHVMPAAARVLDEAGVSPSGVLGTGPGGRILKEDAVRAVADRAKADTPSTPPPAAGYREEESVPMTTMRRRIAERLVEAQQTAAMLTTFNEVDMSAVMNLRTQYQDAFVKKYDIKLGFMSFFVKACVDALKEFPAVNAEIREKNIVYKNYFDIGVAVGGGKGLVVPVVRNAERLSFSEIEKTIKDLGSRAQKNTLRIEELQGGTFTITNGGVYGSLLSTPILNAPQSGILGLHGIQDRPVVKDGQIVIRPMMYVALTYDHRIVDGREAVTFLRRVKEAVEDPTRMLLEV